MNQHEPQVSIVIPVYNGERYVQATLNSILKQTWQDLEVIVVNDGSTDRSMEICRQFNDPRIRYAEQENGGLAAARNAGIRIARGEYLGFIDADDTWSPDKVSRHVEHFRSDPELGLSYSYSSLMDEAGQNLGTLQKEGTNPTTFADCYVRNVIGNGSNAMLRREVFSGRRSNPGLFPPLKTFDPDLRRAEDYELWSRIASLTGWKIACISEVLVQYRINMSGLSSNTTLQRHYHFLATAKIAAYAPLEAELYRSSAIAHLYWHQARTHVQNKNARAGIQAVKFAWHYNWRTLNGNHFLIACALVAMRVIPRAIYLKLAHQAGQVWGRWQNLQVRISRVKTDHSSSSLEGIETLSGMVGEPESYTRKKAMPNLFFLCHKHRLMFAGVSKNASTSLKDIMYREEFGIADSSKLEHVHQLWGWHAQAGRSIELGDTKSFEAYPGYTRFAVYRDPVSRFMSTYHNRVIYNGIAHPFYIGNRLEGMGLEQFINVVEALIRIENPLHIDEHLRPQSWCYEPGDIDYIVPIESLSEFLQVKFGISPRPRHNTTALPRIHPTRQQRERIHKIYACDYAIETNWPATSD